MVRAHVTRTVRRRSLAAVPLALAGVLAGCGAADQTLRPETERPLTAPARSLALGAADLPGFALRDELAPGAYASDDAYGRVGAYAATFVGGTGGMVTSSVNTYVGAAEAQAAFAAWRAAVPRQYRSTTISMRHDTPDAVAYAREGDVLFGYRVRNVLGSVRAPAADVERLVKLVLARCTGR